MISREETKKYIEDTFVFLAISDAFSTVDKIYDSIGSCGECKYYKETSQTVGGNNLLCVLNQKFKANSHFCADFEKKET